MAELEAKTNIDTSYSQFFIAAYFERLEGGS